MITIIEQQKVCALQPSPMISFLHCTPFNMLSMSKIVIPWLTLLLGNHSLADTPLATV